MGPVLGIAGLVVNGIRSASAPPPTMSLPQTSNLANFNPKKDESITGFDEEEDVDEECDEECDEDADVENSSDVSGSNGQNESITGF